MSFLSFLANASVTEVKTRRGGPGGSRKPWNPLSTLLALRFWKDGSVYPSEAAVTRFNLEYPKVNITKGELWPYTEEHVKEFNDKQAAMPEAERKELPVRYKPSLYESVTGISGNGFDVIDSKLWSGFQGEGRMLFISPVAKDQVKVDLFGATKYEDDGTPMTSVLGQGSKTYGPTLTAALKEIYDIELTDAKPFVDLLIVDELQIGDQVVNINKQFSLPTTLVPKVVKRGTDAGKPDYERRDNAIIWGLIPAQLLMSAEDLAAAQPDKVVEEGDKEASEGATV